MFSGQACVPNSSLFENKVCLFCVLLRSVYHESPLLIMPYHYVDLLHFTLKLPLFRENLSFLPYVLSNLLCKAVVSSSILNQYSCMLSDVKFRCSVKFIVHLYLFVFITTYIKHHICYSCTRCHWLSCILMYFQRLISLISFDCHFFLCSCENYCAIGYDHEFCRYRSLAV